MRDEEAARRGSYSLETETPTCTTLGGQEAVTLKAKMTVTSNAATPKEPCSALSWLWSHTQGLSVCSPLHL